KSTCVVVPPKAIPRESSSGPRVCRSSSGCIWIRCARCVCGSTPPGTTILPAASITRVASRNVPGAATAAILPSCTAISHAPAPPSLWTASVSGREQSFEPLGERGPGPAILVLEEDEGVAPAGADAANRLHPGLEARVRVVHRAKPEVPPVGGGQRGRGLVLVLDDGQGRVARTQPVVDVVGEPGLVPELPGHAELGRHHIKDVAEPGEVLLEVRRQLEEQGTQARAEPARDVTEEADGFVHVPES